MANVYLDNYSKRAIGDMLKTTADRLREFEINKLYDGETPPYRDAAVAQEIYESCYPPFVRELLNVVEEELEGDNKDLFIAYLNKSTHTAFSFPYDIIHLNRSFSKRTSVNDMSLWLTYPEQVLSPDYGYMPKLTPDNPKYEELMNLYMMWARDHTISEYDNLVFSMSRFLQGRRTLGQARRDWPEILRFVTPSMKRDLGDTVSKGKPVKDEYSLSEYEKQGLLNMLTEAAALPEDIKLKGEGTNAFSFEKFSRGY